MPDVKVDELTFEAVYASLLEDLDRAYARVRAYHADPKALNPESYEYDAAKRGLNEAAAMLFRFKEIYAIVKGR
ncbi:MAG: hypothetical protein PHV11_10090 [Candidatus Bipolaricaulis sp.]|jgi:hypothetical protein|nr:hypothetical protein [Candidatus Bipolaricaulis sp.]